jgi:HEAT repeat protein
VSDIDKIAKLLRDEAIEKRIAAAIVLGELKAKSPLVADSLASCLESGIPLLQFHALEALARTGAKKAIPLIFPLLLVHADDVRRAAVRALASVGQEVVPIIKARAKTASAEERRALDAALAELGGKDAFSALIGSLAASDPEAAKAAALAVRQEVKTADGNKRRSYLALIEKFLGDQKKAKKESNPGAIAAALKILGYLEDERAAVILVPYLQDEKAHPSVRQEAIIALRFALSKDKPSAKVVDALVRAAEAPDRTLAQTALHTLASLQMGDDVTSKLGKLVSHPDIDRARFVIEQLGRLGTLPACKLLVDALATLDKRYGEAAALALAGKELAVPMLAKALLEAKDRDRAWALRNVLRPLAKKIAPALRKQLLEISLARLGKGELGWEAPLDVARDADATAAAGALRDLATKLKKSKTPEKAATVLGLLSKTDKATDDDRFQLALLELKRSNKDTRAASRVGDEALRLLGQLVSRGFDVAKALRKERGIELDDLYYVGFHFTEQRHALGEELLEEVVKKGGRTKLAKMAKNKLGLAQAD